MISKTDFRSIVLILALMAGQGSWAQAPEAKTKALTPARGHYAALGKLGALPRKENAEWDTQKFPYNKEQAERRLSIKPYYLEHVSPDAFKLPDPPANSSEQTRAEINYLLQLQQQRTKIDVDAALEMAGVFYSVRTKPGDENYRALRQNLFFIGRSMGTWFQPDSLPVTADFMAHVWQDASYFIWYFKYKYLRVRPYVLDKRLENLEETDWAAYPSGHAANSYVNAFIYQELAPEFADVFLKDAYDMAHSREIIGVHYPSDSEVSRVMARQLVNMLFENEKFRRDFEAVKKEWAVKSRGYFGAVEITPSDSNKTGKSCGETSKTSACASTCKSN